MHESRILLAASVSGNVTDVEAFLKEAEYRVTVSDVGAALDEIGRTSFDLLIVPVDALSDALLRAAENAALPVMCLAPENIAPDRVAALYSRGVADYVTTPVFKHSLLARVKNQIEIRAEEVKMHYAKDYLYEFSEAVSNDIKNQFIITSQLCKLICDKKAYDIDDDTEFVLTHIADLCTETHLYIEAAGARATAESRRRGGFVRKPVCC